jgi:TP901-1 family phage major tail protein
MTAQSGSDFLLKIGDGGSPEVFTTVGGFQSNAISLGEQIVETTNKSSPDRFREAMRAGLKTVAISGNGIFTDSAAEESVRANYFGSAVANWQIAIPDFGTIEGPFIVTQLAYTGADNAAVTYSIALESAGSVSFAAA